MNVSDTSRFCTDCLHAELGLVWECHAPHAPRDPVDGSPPTCRSQRAEDMGIVKADTCGPEGTYFTARPPRCVSRWRRLAFWYPDIVP
jgi:hypothetical protein